MFTQHTQRCLFGRFSFIDLFMWAFVVSRPTRSRPTFECQNACLRRIDFPVCTCHTLFVAHVSQTRRCKLPVSSDKTMSGDNVSKVVTRKVHTEHQCRYCTPQLAYSAAASRMKDLFSLTTYRRYAAADQSLLCTCFHAQCSPGTKTKRTRTSAQRCT